MLVPKMVKNGNNSLFTIRNRFCYPFGIHAPKTDQNSERRIKTILDQFRNRHARYRNSGFRIAVYSIPTMPIPYYDIASL
jgi:hypothetical protein